MAPVIAGQVRECAPKRSVNAKHTELDKTATSTICLAVAPSTTAASGSFAGQGRSEIPDGQVSSDRPDGRPNIAGRAASIVGLIVRGQTEMRKCLFTPIKSTNLSNSEHLGPS